jgi:Fe-S cluster biogenesis protein NfuA
MKIQDLADTPNPNAKRFVLDTVVVPAFSSVHATQDTISDHALATTLLDLAGVDEVFLQGNWVTITHSPDTSWDVLSRQIAEGLRQYQPEVGGDATTDDSKSQLPEDDPRVALIRIVIKQDVMPYLNSHGGSLELAALEDNTLYVRYQGACSGCPASMSGTLKGVEAMLRREVDPELTVEAIY